MPPVLVLNVALIARVAPDSESLSINVQHAPTRPVFSNGSCLLTCGQSKVLRRANIIVTRVAQAVLVLALVIV